MFIKWIINTLKDKRSIKKEILDKGITLKNNLTGNLIVGKKKKVLIGKKEIITLWKPDNKGKKSIKKIENSGFKIILSSLLIYRINIMK